MIWIVVWDQQLVWIPKSLAVWCPATMAVIKTTLSIYDCLYDQFRNVYYVSHELRLGVAIDSLSRSVRPQKEGLVNCVKTLALPECWKLQSDCSISNRLCNGLLGSGAARLIDSK